MDTDHELASNEPNAVPDIQPIEIPGQVMNPSVEDRLSEIEKVLAIN